MYRTTDEIGVTTTRQIEVDIIIPVHNASETLTETIQSAMTQVLPERFQNNTWWASRLSIHVCCFDDGSTDDSWTVLQHLQTKYNDTNDDDDSTKGSGHKTTTPYDLARIIPSKLWIAQSVHQTGQGPGYARNRAVEMRLPQLQHDDSDCASLGMHIERFLCWLDSDDTMQPTRVAEQVAYLLNLPFHQRHYTLLGCTFARDPPDATWHYTNWANGLSDDRLWLERFREVTLLQPTWMMSRSRFMQLGGYIEAPSCPDDPRDFLIQRDTKNDHNEPATADDDDDSKKKKKKRILRLVHPTFDTVDSLRIAEDLRLFHAHIHDQGLLCLLRTDPPLVTYRHRSNRPSQSSITSRKLLLHLRALALERCVLCCKNAVSGTSRHEIDDDDNDTWRGPFCIWGAGRDGKDFLKALHPHVQKRVYCFADVDDKKIDSGYCVNRQLQLKIPIVHFSLLAADPAVRRTLTESWEQGEHDDEVAFGRIDKSKRPEGGSFSLPCTSIRTNDNASSSSSPAPPIKKRKLHAIPHPEELDLDLLPKLPVVVCVAMHRTNGALEFNVSRIGRTEGQNLWHFS